MYAICTICICTKVFIPVNLHSCVELYRFHLLNNCRNIKHKPGNPVTTSVFCVCTYLLVFLIISLTLIESVQNYFVDMYTCLSKVYPSVLCIQSLCSEFCHCKCTCIIKAVDA